MKLENEPSMNPSWRYHATKEPRLVKSVSEDEALGSEWAKTPAAFDPLSPEFQGELVAPKAKKAKSKASEGSEA